MKRLRTSNQSGLTLVETAIAVAILVLLVTAALTAVLTTQRAFTQSEIVGRIRARAQNAMERIVALSSKAVTSDPAFSTLNPTTGVGAHGLRFRLIEWKGNWLIDKFRRCEPFEVPDGIAELEAYMMEVGHVS